MGKTLDSIKEEGRDNIFIYPLIDSGDNALKNKEDKFPVIIDDKTINGYMTHNVMGFIGRKNEFVKITSRFPTRKKDPNVDNDYFLRYLIEKALKIPNIVSLDLLSGKDVMFDLLVFLLPDRIREAMRKGLYKTYVTYKYNDSNVKGVIDIPRHIKMNTPCIGKIAYNVRELSYDNYVTELVRHTIEFIYETGRGTILEGERENVQDIRFHTPRYNPADRQKIISINKKNIVTHTYYSEYRELQSLCLDILQYFMKGVGKDDNGDQIHGVLFDGWSLWENYVYTLVKDFGFLHPDNRTEEGKEWLFVNEKTLNGNQEIFSDFISESEKPRIIMDAKYKPMGNIKRDDYFQVLSYMYRFDSKVGFYLYPYEPKENEETTLKLYLKKGYYPNDEEAKEKHDDIFVIKHGLKVPTNAKDYYDFVETMKKSEESFTNYIKEICSCTLI